MKLPIAVIIMTRNEEKNIESCLRSVQGFADEVFVIDSHSTDRTVELARSFGAVVFENEWINYATQFNWSLSHAPIRSAWVMRLDADERLTPELRQELLDVLPGLGNDVTGIYIKRRVYFMHRWMKRGGYYPIWLLRIWKKGCGHCEVRWMDEHIDLTCGKSVSLKNDIVEENAKNLHWWIGKHNDYATREVIDLLNPIYHFSDYAVIPGSLRGTQQQRTRWIKEHIYIFLPLFVRPFFYFIYRYFIRLGFLDGIEGLIWHFLQGFWYRFLVDAKIFEIYRKAGKGRERIRQFIRDEYNITL